MARFQTTLSRLRRIVAQRRMMTLLFGCFVVCALYSRQEDAPKSHVRNLPSSPNYETSVMQIAELRSTNEELKTRIEPTGLGEVHEEPLQAKINRATVEQEKQACKENNTRLQGIIKQLESELALLRRTKIESRWYINSKNGSQFLDYEVQSPKTIDSTTMPTQRKEVTSATLISHTLLLAAK